MKRLLLLLIPALAVTLVAQFVELSAVEPAGAFAKFDPGSRDEIATTPSTPARDAIDPLPEIPSSSSVVSADPVPHSIDEPMTGKAADAPSPLPDIDPLDFESKYEGASFEEVQRALQKIQSTLGLEHHAAMVSAIESGYGQPAEPGQYEVTGDCPEGHIWGACFSEADQTLYGVSLSPEDCPNVFALHDELQWLWLRQSELLR